MRRWSPRSTPPRVSLAPSRPLRRPSTGQTRPVTPSPESSALTPSIPPCIHNLHSLRFARSHSDPGDVFERIFFRSKHYRQSRWHGHALKKPVMVHLRVLPSSLFSKTLLTFSLFAPFLIIKFPLGSKPTEGPTEYCFQTNINLDSQKYPPL